MSNVLATTNFTTKVYKMMCHFLTTKKKEKRKKKEEEVHKKFVYYHNHVILITFITMLICKVFIKISSGFSIFLLKKFKLYTNINNNKCKYATILNN